jgi:stringent starvation protein B
MALYVTPRARRLSFQEPMSHPLPPKKDVALALLERSSVHVHLDPRGAGVVVPPWFKRQPQLVLQIGLNMPVPIPDLRLDEEGLACTLSFNRSPFYCVVPWLSVFAMVGDDGRGMVWPDEVPPEIAKQPRGPEAVPSQKAPESPPALAVAPAPAGAGKKPGSRRGADKDDKSVASEKGAKKPRKKRGAPEPIAETRPQLVAVPPAEPSSPRAPPQAARPVPAPAPARAPMRAPPSPSKKSPSKKRELPPYLRVVK